MSIELRCTYKFGNKTTQFNLRTVPQLSAQSMEILKHLGQVVPLPLQTPLEERVVLLENIEQQLKETQEGSLENNFLAMVVGALGVALVAGSIIFGFRAGGWGGGFLAIGIGLFQAWLYPNRPGDRKYGYLFSYLGAGLLVWCEEIVMKESLLKGRFEEMRKILDQEISEGRTENKQRIPILVEFYTGDLALSLLWVLANHVTKSRQLLRQIDYPVPDPTRRAEICAHIEQCQQTISELQALQVFYTAFIVI